MGIGLAMWSGPRNISTAMMRSWENRSDCTVMDEPFYAHYLQHTGIDHPMAEQIINAYETDWRKVAAQISTVPEHGIFYQKHICTHMLPHIELDWLDALSHVFLIRDPKYMVASYAQKRADITVADFGYEELAKVFTLVMEQTGDAPLVIDSQAFLARPQQHLEYLCSKLGIAFDNNMLNWPAGARDSDGIWGQHWYDAVNKSTGFGPARQSDIKLTPELQLVADACMGHYDTLARHAISS